MKGIFKFTGFISFVLVLAFVVCAVFIPETQSAMADWATKYSPKHQEVLDANAELKNQNKELSEELSNKNQAIEELNSTLESKNQQLAEKDTQIANKDQEIASKTSQINTLSTQKTTLLSAVTEIDNKINSTTDSVELEELETKKANILAQIDDLNSQITTLEAEKSQLESEIATLQSEKSELEVEIKTLKAEKAQLQAEVEALESSKGVSLDFEYYSFGAFKCRLNETCPFVIGYSTLYSIEEVVPSKWCFATFNYCGFSTRQNFSLCELDTFALNFYIDDCEVDFASLQTYLNENYNSDDYLQTNCTFSLTNINETECLNIKIVITTEPILTGQYSGLRNQIIDFDNPENTSCVHCPDECIFIGLSYSIWDDCVSLYSCGKYVCRSTKFSMIDDTTFILNDEDTYIKVID